MPRLRPRREKDTEPVTVPVIEAAICVEEFRPAPVGVLYRRYQQLPLDHPVVQAHPSFFRGLVRLEPEDKAK